MDAERLREFLIQLPYVEETMQWGEKLVYRVGDKAIGGRMFALVNLEKERSPYMSFHAGPERFAELLEREGVVPAPYMARIYWVALERHHTLPEAELKECLRSAHARVMARLPARTREVFAMTPTARTRLIRDRRKLLSERKKQFAEEKGSPPTPEAPGRTVARRGKE